MKDIFKHIFEEFWSYGLPEIKERDLVLPLVTGKVILLSGVKHCGKTFLFYESIRNLIKSGVEKKI